MKVNLRGYLFVFLVLTSITASPLISPGAQQNADRVLSAGDPPLTQSMILKLESVYESLLEIKLTSDERRRFQMGVLHYWEANDQDSIRRLVSNLKYSELSPAELAEFRASSQAAILEGMRRDTEAPEELVLVEAFDREHPDRSAATPRKGFADLVGTWKRVNYLLATRDPNNGVPRGVSFTDSGTLVVTANGRFKLVKAHNHCSGGCCRLDGSEEYGILAAEGSQLVFNVERGSMLIEDDCNKSLNQRRAVEPRRDSFTWSVRPNPQKNGTTVLCWNTDAESAICFEKL